MKRFFLLSFLIGTSPLLPAQRANSDACICLALTPHIGFIRQDLAELDSEVKHQILPERRLLGTSWGTDLTLHRNSDIYYGLGYSRYMSISMPGKLRPTETWHNTGGWLKSDYLAAIFGVKLMRPAFFWRAMIDGSIGHLRTNGNITFAGHDVSIEHSSLAVSISPSIAYLVNERIALGLKGSYTWTEYTGDFLFDWEHQRTNTSESRRVRNEVWTAHMSLSYLVNL